MATDSMVAEFVTLTCASTEEAKSYLEMANGNLQEAVNLFMEMGGSSGGTGGGGGAPASGSGGDDDVRAPIPAFNDQIVEQQVKRRRVEVEHAMEFDSLTMNSRMSFDRPDQSAYSGGSQKTATSQAMNELFAIPAYNEGAPLGKVVERAKDEGKWILVNIQQAEMFASHRLNRDVWSDEIIKDMVTDSFLFWQRDDKAVEGNQFCKHYNIGGQQLPHICVVDPRTGRSVKSWDGQKWKDSRVAAEFLMGFLDKFSMPQAPQAPQAQPAAQIASSAPSQPSAQPSGEAPKPDAKPPAPGSKEAAADGGKSLATPAVDGGSGAGDGPAPDEPIADMPDEPADGAESLKVSFRLPSGQRVMRRFSPADAVQQMFNVASALAKKPVRLIDLSTQFPKRSLRDIQGGLELPMKDAQVAGNMVLVNVRSS